VKQLKSVFLMFVFRTFAGFVGCSFFLLTVLPYSDAPIYRVSCPILSAVNKDLFKMRSEHITNNKLCAV